MKTENEIISEILSKNGINIYIQEAMIWFVKKIPVNFIREIVVADMSPVNHNYILMENGMTISFDHEIGDIIILPEWHNFSKANNKPIISTASLTDYNFYKNVDIDNLDEISLSVVKALGGFDNNLTDWEKKRLLNSTNTYKLKSKFYHFFTNKRVLRIESFKIGPDSYNRSYYLNDGFRFNPENKTDEEIDEYVSKFSKNNNNSHPKEAAMILKNIKSNKNLSYYLAPTESCAERDIFVMRDGTRFGIVKTNNNFYFLPIIISSYADRDLIKIDDKILNITEDDSLVMEYKGLEQGLNPIIDSIALSYKIKNRVLKVKPYPLEKNIIV